MANKNNLYRRAKTGVYYIRIYVPLDVQGVVGKKEVNHSLRTTDPAEARRLRSAEIEQWNRRFDEARRKLALSDDDIQTAVWDYYQNGLELADTERRQRPSREQVMEALMQATNSPAQGDHQPGAFDHINRYSDALLLANKAKYAATLRDKKLARFRSDLAAGNYERIATEADAFLARHNFTIDRDSPLYRELAEKLMRAEIQVLERYAERDEGNFSGLPTDPVIRAPLIRTGAATADTIGTLLGKYASENPNEVRPETLAQAKRDVGHFEDFVGKGSPVSKITKAAVRDWKGVLEAYPVKATETKAFAGLRPQEAVEANRRLAEPKPTLSRQTVRRYMASLSGFCQWLVRNDYIAANPVLDLLPRKAEPTNKRKSFLDEELETLFASPLFMGAARSSWSQVHIEGPVGIRDHRFWIPFVMLFSGARPAEIAQLHVDDVRDENGIAVMEIRADEETGRRTKTVGSRRLVPVHSCLTKLGFLDLVQRRRQAGDVQLFPEIEIPREGQIAAQFSREFNRYLGKVGIKTDRSLVLYSLRHTFIDRARLAEVLDQEIALVVGHETGVAKKTMTSGYGTVTQGTIRRRAEIVESVTYKWFPGLLSALESA